MLDRAEPAGLLREKICCVMFSSDVQRRIHMGRLLHARSGWSLGSAPSGSPSGGSLAVMGVVLCAVKLKEGMQWRKT